jgi:hypothetical protein
MKLEARVAESAVELDLARGPFEDPVANPGSAN